MSGVNNTNYCDLVCLVTKMAKSPEGHGIMKDFGGQGKALALSANARERQSVPNSPAKNISSEKVTCFSNIDWVS